MSRRAVQATVLSLIFLFVGVGAAAVVLASVPDPGSAPSIYDDFNWSSTSNGFWHVNAIGSTARIKHGILTLKGHSIELDRRLQTDPYETVVVAKVRGRHFHKFALGLGVYHAGAVGLEYDDDGVKCGYPTDLGWQVAIMKHWSSPPVGQWSYLELAVKNPYPTTEELTKAEQQSEKTGKTLTPVTVTCSMYDAAGHLVATATPRAPVVNAHYVAFDEAYLRTWDSHNQYDVDWVYAGPTSGIPSDAPLPHAT